MANDIWEIIQNAPGTFPGSWERDRDTAKLKLPGCVLTVGPNGFSGSTGGGPLSINVSVRRYKDVHPMGFHLPLPFSRTYARGGHTTAWPPKEVVTETSLYERLYKPLTLSQWVFDSLCEAYDWLRESEGIEIAA